MSTELTRSQKILGLLVYLVFLPSLAGTIGYVVADHLLKRDAVRAGVGEWIPDDHGQTKFRFKGAKDVGQAK